MAEAQHSHRVSTARDLRQFGLLVRSETQKGKAIFLGSRSLIPLVFHQHSEDSGRKARKFLGNRLSFCGDATPLHHSCPSPTHVPSEPRLPYYPDTNPPRPTCFPTWVVLEYCHSFTSAACVFCSHAPGSSLVYQTPVPSPHELQHTSADVTLGVEGHGSLACCSSRGHKELDMTERLNNHIHSPQSASCLSSHCLIRVGLCSFSWVTERFLRNSWDEADRCYCRSSL